MNILRNNYPGRESIKDTATVWKWTDITAYMKPIPFESIVDEGALIGYLIATITAYPVRERAQASLQQKLHGLLSQLLAHLYLQANKSCIEHWGVNLEKSQQLKQSLLYSLLSNSQHKVSLEHIANTHTFSLSNEAYAHIISKMRNQYVLWTSKGIFEKLFTPKTVNIREPFIAHGSLKDVPLQHIKDWVLTPWVWYVRKQSNRRQHYTHQTYYSISDVYTKITSLQQPGDNITFKRYLSESETLLMVISLHRLNGVEREKTIVVCDDPKQPRATYIIDWNDDFQTVLETAWYTMTINGIYQYLYDKKKNTILGDDYRHDKDIHRIITSKSEQMSLDAMRDNTVKRIIDYALNPKETLTKTYISTHATDAEILKLILVDLLEKSEEKRSRLLDKDTYSLLAHKANKVLIAHNERWPYKPLLATDKNAYATFLEIIKDPKITFPAFKMQKNYVHYIMHELKEIPDHASYRDIITSIFKHETIDTHEQVVAYIATIPDQEFKDKTKARNKASRTHKFFIFECKTYTTLYFQESWS
jgi:hypothetical protein